MKSEKNIKLHFLSHKVIKSIILIEVEEVLILKDSKEATQKEIIIYSLVKDQRLIKDINKI